MEAGINVEGGQNIQINECGGWNKRGVWKNCKCGGWTINVEGENLLVRISTKQHL